MALNLSSKAKYLVLILFGVVLAYYYFWRDQGFVPMFDDITMQSDISYVGVTYGAAWADIDGDGRPDLYLTNHLNKASLYINLGGGRFKDMTKEYFLDSQIGGDKHGAAWADFNNDGRQELVQLTGAVRGVGAEAKRLYMRNGDRFEDVASIVGVANLLGRTRMPLWFDFDNDGQLDLFQGSVPRLDSQTSPFIFMQKNGKFVEDEAQFSHFSKNIPFCIITDMNSDSRPDLVCRASGKNQTAIIYDSTKHALDKSLFLPASAFEDMVAGDFDNDGHMDIFLARRNPAGAVAFGQAKRNEIMVDFSFDRKNFNKLEGIDFETTGHLFVSITSVWPIDWLSPKNIYIGDRGLHPSGLEFELTREAGASQGREMPESGREKGIYIIRNGEYKWSIFASSAQDDFAAQPAAHQEYAIKIVSTEPITSLVPRGEMLGNEETQPRLFMNRREKLVDESKAAGIEDMHISAVNVVAGDFDNDMNLDLFIVGSNAIGKTSNVLLLNRGNGHFDKVKDAGGAAGTKAGVGDSVTVVDFDGDGFLDILVSSGGSMGRSEGPVSAAGSYHLYHNLGKKNNWLEIDLIGKKSNRDGIGAKVELFVGGVTQTRIQDGGVHNSGQNSSRLHFGLARNSTAEKIVVYWPSGVKQVLHDIPANRIIKIEEGD